MDQPQPGVGARSPADLALASRLICPITRRPQPMLRCPSCRHFHGMLVAPAPCVLCAVPTREPRSRTRSHRSTLIFDRDWPDD